MSNQINILDYIESPRDLHALSKEDLDALASEIRARIVDTTSQTGGHVASSLGAVEIILALHSVLNSPEDRIIFDVGHQAYAHKLVTGRAQRFDTLRTYHGLSGFPRPSESEHDTHPSGHASDSLSVASGIAQALRQSGKPGKVAVIIGDAALAGGMAFEALNYIGSQQLPILIILNDNEMSISSNVGALMKHFGNIRATSQYRDARESLQDRLERGGNFGNIFAEFGKRAKESMKQMFIPESMLYENMGIVCTPPIDGHDIGFLREMIELVLPMDGPVLIHAVTKKGAGYRPAEENPEKFHGIGPYDVETGYAYPPTDSAKTCTQVFGEALVREAEANKDVFAITAAMEGGTGLKAFHDKFPDRFVDVGIAEEQAVGMASGLAIAGKKPVVALYSTFMQRAIDQMIVDVALPSLDVVFALDRAGLVGDDGPTHHGVFDLAYLRMVPNMKVIVPSTLEDLEAAVSVALTLPGPVAIRYPRGSLPLAYEGCGASGISETSGTPETSETLETSETTPSLMHSDLQNNPVPNGSFASSEYTHPSKTTPSLPGARVVRQGSDVAILAFGRMVANALEAAEMLAAQNISARVVDMIWAKPLDEAAINDAAKLPLVVSVEEGVLEGGVGEGILQVLSANNATCKTLALGIPDQFIMQGKCEFLLDEIGLSAEKIAQKISEELGE